MVIKGQIAVTGANGFAGRAVVTAFSRQGRMVRPLVRSFHNTEVVPGGVMEVGDIGPATDWTTVLNGVDCVVHLAARAHVMDDSAPEPLAAYREVNVAGTRRLAEQAAAAGVRRLVMVSSIKVNGERTAPGAPFLFSDPPAPEDAYGLSKWEAEQALWLVAAETGLEVVVVRPPLVYGPGARGNFQRLLRWVARGLPLPLGAVENRRSLVALDNLVDLLRVCIDHPAAAGQTFLVSDGEDLSTPELIRRLAAAMGRKPRLLPVPPALLRLGGWLLGRSGEVARLLGSLQVDIAHTREILGWTPPISVQDGLRRTVEGPRKDDAV